MKIKEQMVRTHPCKSYQLRVERDVLSAMLCEYVNQWFSGLDLSVSQANAFAIIEIHNQKTITK